MVRSMYSGVAGMKAHQVKMDVIGNNISNVNTYGFKSSRATFRDVYYQNIRNAAAPTGLTGGINPSAVGYGASIGSVDLLMTPSSVTNTGNPMDLAINGDGFFQVADADGNTFYTRAGMTDIDSQGNLVDMNGYFVLGVSGSPIGQKPSHNHINVLDAMGSVDATKANKSESINGVKYTITASKNTAEGNVAFQFVPADNLPIGQKAEAIVGTSAITIRLNEKESFASLGELQTQVNTAITAALKGKPHPAGDFTFTMEPADGHWPATGLTGAEICGTNYGYVQGKLPYPSITTTGGVVTNAPLFGGLTVKEVGNLFLSKVTTPGEPTYNMSYDAAAKAWTVSVTISTTNTYTQVIKDDQMTSASDIILHRTGLPTDSQEYNEDTITMTLPSLDTIRAAYDKDQGTTTDWNTVTGTLPFRQKAATPDTVVGGVANATASYASPDLGLGSRTIKLGNGTQGGPLQVKDLTGVAIGPDGVIVASHAILGQKEVGRIDLANFNNPAALNQVGNSYFSVSQNSGVPGLSIPGSSGVGSIKSSSLEMSNVDLSQEFADMITTQRGYQANSRLITVSDSMLEELVNLKR